MSCNIFSGKLGVGLAVGLPTISLVLMITSIIKDKNIPLFIATLTVSVATGLYLVGCAYYHCRFDACLVQETGVHTAANELTTQIESSVSEVSMGMAS